MSDMLNAKRDARAAAEAHERDLEANGGSEESENDRAKRIIAQNLKSQRGKDYEQGGGGIFDVRDKGLHDATLIFHGWNRELSRNFGKEIVVKQGNEPNIDSAIVDEVIKIIREQYNGDFVWDSPRLGKSVTRSARKEDEPALKEFLYQEFSYIEDINLNRRPPPDPPQRRGR
jgi:hypothetical protein